MASVQQLRETVKKVAAEEKRLGEAIKKFESNNKQLMDSALKALAGTTTGADADVRNNIQQSIQAINEAVQSLNEGAQEAESYAQSL